MTNRITWAFTAGCTLMFGLLVSSAVITPSAFAAEMELNIKCICNCKDNDGYHLKEKKKSIYTTWVFNKEDGVDADTDCEALNDSTCRGYLRGVKKPGELDGCYKDIEADDPVDSSLYPNGHF